MDHKNRIIGLSGSNGAGKDMVGQLLAQYYNYLFISVTELLREECRRRGLSVARENLRKISAQWRRERGLAVLVDQAIQTFEAAPGKHAGLAMASLRNPYEADRVHELGGIVVWVDADPKIRYQRVIAGDRGRDSEDNRTFEQFLAEEQAEMHPPPGADAAALNMAAVRDRSDFALNNDTNSLDILLRDLIIALRLQTLPKS